VNFYVFLDASDVSDGCSVEYTRIVNRNVEI
jgi:hypothetical protein